MALEGHIIQVNTNHSARAQDMLAQTMAELGSELAVVSEPYRIPENNSAGDLSGTVMILRAGSIDSPGIEMIERGRGYVAVKWNQMIVIGLYASPNEPITSLQEILDRTRDCVRRLDNCNVLIMGDFNAKSALWGSPKTNPRGNAVVDWAAELDLQLLNEGNKNTCVRWQGGSIVDLTWASPSAARKVRGWRVAEELESLSDHRYILVTLQSDASRTSRGHRESQRRGDGERRQRDTHHPRWSV